MEIKQTCGEFIGTIKENVGTDRKVELKAKSVMQLVKLAFKENDTKVMPILAITFKDNAIS